MTRVIKSRARDLPVHAPAPAFWRLLAHSRFEYDAARGDAPPWPPGPVTIEDRETLVLWDRSGQQVITRYRFQPTVRVGRDYVMNIQRRAYELLEEL